MRFVRRVVFQNFGLKLLALLMSFLLWRTYTAEPFAQVGYDVPIAFVNVPAGMAVAGEAPAVARVVIDGRSGLLRRLTPADLSFSVDLNRAHAGEMLVRLTAAEVRVPYGTEVVHITPGDFRLSLVPTSTPLPGPE